jgi:hypothetical protein
MGYISVASSLRMMGMATHRLFAAARIPSL